jgi:citronellol/citronellal dehydrogenase
MSMMTIGWAAEFKNKIAVNSVWPRTTIATAAVKNLLGGEALMQMSRKPEILADAAYYILKQPVADCSGNLFIDEDVLAKEGITNLDKYAVVPGGQLYNDLFVEE